jgi:predicted peptidase
MDKNRPLFDAIDWLLVTAIVGLSIFLLAEFSGPAIASWRSRPRSGVQVCQEYVAKIGEGRDAVETGTYYLLYLPQDYNRKNQWPLVVFLHGAGERGNDLERVRRMGLPREVETGNLGDQFILVSPQCPKDSIWMPELVIALTEHISNSFSVDRDRVYLTGFSMGGSGTWQTACHDPGRFAAIVPLSGGGDANQAERLKDVPIWVFHGANDKTVPLSASQVMVNAVQKCGGHVEFTVYPEHKHSICEVTYQNPKLYEWLLAKRRQ